MIKNIINDVRKNGDKALIKYEMKYAKNNEIISKKKKITNSITSLDLKIKKAIDFSYNRILKFHSRQKVQNISEYMGFFNIFEKFRFSICFLKCLHF